MQFHRQPIHNACSSFADTGSNRKAKIVIIDGFGQRENDHVTGQVAAALRDAFPHAEVPDPIATAQTIGQDTTLQLSFSQQAERLRAALRCDGREVHVYAYSQGAFPAAMILASQRFAHVASVTLVGTPLQASREQKRIDALDISDMGEVFAYVADQLPDTLPASLVAVARYEQRGGLPRYVGISQEYVDDFPDDDTHYRNLSAVALMYPTTLVSLGAERVTDCTPDNARAFAADADITFARGLDDLDPIHPRQAVVIDGAPHRLGREHRTVTVPRLYRLRTTLAEDAWFPHSVRS